MTFTIVALLSRTAAKRELHDALAHRARVLHCADRLELLRTILATDPAAVVVEVRDATGQLTAGTVSAIRTRRPALPVLLYCAAPVEEAGWLFEFARAGATDVIWPGTVGEALRSVLARSLVFGQLGAVRAALERACPAALHPLVGLCLERAGEPLTVDDLAGALGISARALSKRLKAAGFPPPGVFLSCCRLALAGYRLACGERPVERVAHAVGFSSDNALRNALRRYAGVTPGDARLRYDLDWLVGRLMRFAEPPLSERRLEA